MAGGDMRNARTTGGRLAVSISVLIASGCLGIAGTWSAFSGTTSNAGNTFAAGTVVLSDDDGGAAMFTLPGLDPGETATRCIDVAYTGSLPALVRLRASTTGTGLDSALDLVVTRGSFAMPPGADPAPASPPTPPTTWAAEPGRSGTAPSATTRAGGRPA
jgi:hypothetical protein